MDTTALSHRSLTETAAEIRERKLSPVEVTEALLDRIAAIDAQLNAYLTLTATSALAQARAAEAEIAAGRYRGPLHGIPIGIKDLCATRGVPTTCASRVLADWIPDFDATVVRRLNEAGAVVLGKLNMTEFALSGYHPSLPVPRNPWNLEAHASGSSSGSGVAVAAGLCFAAVGTDTGGSIRGPAAWNGTVGLKPTYGRVSRAGVFPLAMSLDHVGPLTRTVTDAAAMFAAMAGFDEDDPTSLQAPIPGLEAMCSTDIRGLRIGYDETYNAGGAMPDLVAAVEETGRVLERAGARLVPVTLPPIDGILPHWFTICSAEALVAHADLYPRRSADYGRTFRSLLELGSRIRGTEYVRANESRRSFAGALQSTFSQIDAFLCPGTFGTAPPAVAIDPQGELTPEFAPFMRYSSPFNFSGHPTLSLPCGFSTAGLPFGAQLVGSHLGEARLLNLGCRFQRETDWHLSRPLIG